MRRAVCSLLCLTVTLFAAAPSAHADKRVALVIGNSAYEHVPDLANPVNDARLVAGALGNLGFTLIGGGAQLDLDKSRLDRAVQSFGSEIQGADVALFYYAGHGVQVHGHNYLVPVGANPVREADVDFQMLDTNLVLRQMEGSGSRLNLVILDACRNNPFGGRGLRTASGGLAQMQAPEGTLISFATQPGSVALDGTGGNSPFTKAFADTIRRPGLDIFRTFNEIGLAVKQATGGAQQPWVSSSPISGDFFFAARQTAPEPAAPPAQPQPPRSPAGQAWTAMQNTQSPAVLEAFIKAFPDSVFATFAKARLKELTGNKVAVAVSPKTPEPLPNSSQTTTRKPDNLLLDAKIWPVGKWPEGIAWDGTSLWVAESGQRQLARLDPHTGRVVERVKVGRLPVGVVATSDGHVHASVATDKTIWQQPGAGKRGRAIARLKQYPQAIDGDDQTLWVLTWINGSSAQTQVARIDLRTGKSSLSPVLPKNGFDLAVGDLVWTLHRYDGENRSELIGLDRTSLAVRSRIAFQGYGNRVVVGRGGVFAAGGPGGGLVVKLDPQSGRETARFTFNSTVGALATDGDQVIAMDMEGTIRILSADRLSLLRTIHLKAGQYRPQSILLAGGTLFISSQKGQGDNGSVLAVSDWRP